MHKDFPNLFAFVDKYNHQVFKNNITNIGVIYRNYNDPKRKVELIKIKKACKKKGYQLYVSNSIKLALEIKADGIYIPAFNKSQKFKNLERKNFVILGSAHNEKEIQEKIMQKCKAIFVSPIFNVKKTNKFLGVGKFNLLTHSKKIDIFVHFWTRFLKPCATPCPWKASPILLGGGRRWYAAWHLQLIPSTVFPPSCDGILLRGKPARAYYHSSKNRSQSCLTHKRLTGIIGSYNHLSKVAEFTISQNDF